VRWPGACGPCSEPQGALDNGGLDFFECGLTTGSAGATGYTSAAGLAVGADVPVCAGAVALGAGDVVADAVGLGVAVGFGVGLGVLVALGLGSGFGELGAGSSAPGAQLCVADGWA
jgi:hypothetical protein